MRTGEVPSPSTQEGRASSSAPSSSSVPLRAVSDETVAVSGRQQQRRRRLQFRLGRLSALIRVRRVYNSILRSEELLDVLPVLLRMHDNAHNETENDSTEEHNHDVDGAPPSSPERRWSLPLPAGANLSGLAVGRLEGPAFAGSPAAADVIGDGNAMAETQAQLESESGENLVAEGEVAASGSAGDASSNFALGGDWPLLLKLMDMVEELQMLSARMRSEVREMDAASAYRFLFISEESKQLVRPELITQGEAQRLVVGAVNRQAEKIRNTIALLLRDVPFRSPADARAVLGALEAQGFRFEDSNDAGAVGGIARDGFLSQLTERYDSFFKGTGADDLPSSASSATKALRTTESAAIELGGGAGDSMAENAVDETGASGDRLGVGVHVAWRWRRSHDSEVRRVYIAAAGRRAR